MHDYDEDREQNSVRSGKYEAELSLDVLAHWLMPISCHFRDCKALLVTSL